ncbi:glnS, partial [Symbiodinium sp. CCMP2456]
EVAIDQLLNSSRCQQLFQELLANHEKHVPELLEELRGIASGANVSSERLFAMSLQEELAYCQENLTVTARRVDHCTDSMLCNSQYCFDAHNEDGDMADKWLFAAFVQFGKSSFTVLNYAGDLLGGMSAFAFNKRGIAFSLNWVGPGDCDPAGLGRNFISRQLLTARGWDEAQRIISQRHAAGHNYQLMDFKSRRIANFEVAHDQVSEVAIGNAFFHVNQYQTLSVPDQMVGNSSLHRLARLRMLPAPQSVLQGVAALVLRRDPIMYRILPNTPHPRTGSEWPIYPSYDWAHGLSDAIEGVTHSVCTLEFNMHNELYDWFNEKVAGLPDALPLCQPPSSALPRQHEFARLEMTHIVVSKRKLKRLVEGGYVEGWDDPRMPTISGMRRRGYPPAALRKLCELIGVTKVPTSVIEYTLLENCVRDVLQEQVSEKLLCVLRPLPVTITNWPEGQEDELIEVPGGDSDAMPRQMHFGRDLLLDMEDFQEEPEPGFKRLAPGRQVKLRYGYVIKCDEVVRGPDGEIQELRCSYDPDSLGKRPPKKVAVVHWAHQTLSTPVTVRMYDKLFSEPRPEEAGDFLDALNPKSCEVLASARCEPSVAGMVEKHKESGEDIFRVQFERCGFFAMDPKASSDGLVFNCTVPQRSDFGKAKQVRGKASKKKLETAAASPVAQQVFGRPAVMSTAFAVPRPSLIDLKALPAQASCRKSRCQSSSRELSSTEHGRHIGAAAAVLYCLRRGTKIARQAQRSREQAISAAVNIARDSTRRGRGRMSMQERKKLRMMEVQRKIRVLKGTRAVPGKPDKDASSDDDTSNEDSADDEEGSGGSSSSSAPVNEDEAGEGQENWAFKREDKSKSSFKRRPLQVSDDARAVAETELYGQGGIATSKQLLDAGREFMFAKDWEKAADLLELVSDRISKEQLSRKLDYKVAQAIDDEATETLAMVYADSGRLSLAFNTYDVLRTRVADPEVRKRAEVGWIQTAVRISESLQKEFRFDQCLELLLTVRVLPARFSHATVAFRPYPGLTTRMWQKRWKVSAWCYVAMYKLAAHACVYRQRSHDLSRITDAM